MLIHRNMFLSSILILLTILLAIPRVYAQASLDDENYAVRRVVLDYTQAMNEKSVENIITLYTTDGKYIDESFDGIFFGPDQLRNLYQNIFNRNPRLTFTAFPWNIEVTGDSAFVTCSWSLVTDYGVYNGVYLINMSSVNGEWKIAKITAYVTVVHDYHPLYRLIP